MDGPKFIQKTMILLEELMRSPLVSVAGKSQYGQLEGILAILKSISQGVAPDIRMQQSSQNAFYTQCLKRITNFAKTELDDSVPNGIRALELHYNLRETLNKRRQVAVVGRCLTFEVIQLRSDNLAGRDSEVLE